MDTSNFNTGNVFVVLRSNSVKGFSSRYEPGEYLPEGTFLFQWSSQFSSITDESLTNKNSKDRRKHFTLDVISKEIKKSAYGKPYHMSSDVMPCQIRRATAEEVQTCIALEQNYNTELNAYNAAEDERYREENRKWREEEDKRLANEENFRNSRAGKKLRMKSWLLEKVIVFLAIISTKLSIKISKYTKELVKTEKSLFNSPWKVKYRIYDEVFEKVFGMDRHKYEEKMYEKHSNWKNRDEDDEFDDMIGRMCCRGGFSPFFF